jgi:hypothetical protein
MQRKWNLQDIRPVRPERPVKEERAADMVRPSAPRDIVPQRRPVRTEEEPLDPDLASLDILDGNAIKRKRVIITSLIALAFIGSAIGVNMLMSGAEITVYPKFKDVSVQASFTTYKMPQAGELSFELLTLEATGERQVSASGKERVSERASGNVFVYNNQPSTQRLIKNTRFESPEGFIFKIPESIEVPGASTDASGKTVPGMITVEVFADGTGEQYNIPATRFTVPGLKGRPEFDAVYGESALEFTGGFEGDKYIIDDAELEARKQELHLELRNTLLSRLETEKPAGFIAYPDAVTISFESLPATAYGDQLATIKERARLSIPLFKESEFAKYLADSTVAGYDNEDVVLESPQNLTFAYSLSTTTVTDISGYSELSFELRGNTRIIWAYDEEKLKNDLLGLSKTALPAVLGAYPSIDRAEAIVRPFWASTFPESAEKLTVTKSITENTPTSE